MTQSPHPAPHPEWESGALDLDAYLNRIGQPRRAPSADALRALQEAHVRAIPFENVEPFTGRSPELTLEAITAKLVRRSRGGYCYEHALLFAAAAERLGYPVRRLMARVQPNRPGPHTHMTLVVRADGVDHLVDPGFGAGMLHPMPLVDGAVMDQAGWKHRLTQDGALWTLERRTADGWEALHAFDETARRPIDYEVANHYVANHPRSPFSGRLVVMRLAPGISRRLVGDELTVERADGRVERRTVPPGALDATLRGLDVVLDPAELAAALARYLGDRASAGDLDRPATR
ncbi:N-hydroxyarylamine O-acetyltransferase [Amycolatopsis arida]|uniref:N-hydroxyarylamine O-acetyltransferase n=1 Tax=Amycolatopsis arida TaxID=587909 RepID=A0A1I6AT48_9PSEU|nr:arylamine N-acetyltransferase [Amycolatopsis arida]TDX97548.1 N-hydroxyarylamine O-acetyltransferase [Amycolatopsis arida]SFQ71707.1 N-hydroxyarylamine O-acetyltransferase [Amycolatopsis arida]